MSSDFQNQLIDIDELMINGKYIDAMNSIEKILNGVFVKKEDEILVISYKIKIMNSLGEYQEAINLINKTLEFLKKKISLVKLELLLQKGLALAYQRKKEEITELINNIETDLKKLQEISIEDENRIKASIYRLRLFITSSRVEPKKYLKYAKNCHKFALKSKDILLINFGLIHLAHAHHRLNEKDKSLELMNEAYQHASSINYIQGQEDSLWGLSYFESDREKSLDYAEKAIAFHEKIDSKRSSYGTYVYMGCKYVQNCYFEKALVSLNKAEKLLKEDDEQKYSIYFVYARVFTLKGEFNLAYENILKAQKIAKESNQLMYAQSFFDLLLLALDLQKLELAEKHQKELDNLSKELDDEEIQQLSKLAKALVLKANKGIRDWSQSITILEELLENEALSSSIVIDATLNLCELLIREIELTGEIDLLESIQIHLTKLQEIAESQKIYWLIIEILRLKAQLSLIIYDINKARELLNAALRISQNKGIEKLTVEIINEQIEIEEKITIWEKLQEIDAPLIESLKHVHLLNNIVEINQKTATVKSCSGNRNTIEYRKLFAIKI